MERWQNYISLDLFRNLGRMSNYTYTRKNRSITCMIAQSVEITAKNKVAQVNWKKLKRY